MLLSSPLRRWIAAACCAIVSSAAASAATFKVTALSDVTDPNDGVLSLREAITAANAAGGANTITFDATFFAGGAPLYIFLTGSLPDVANSLTITGPGANLLTVYGDSAHRLLRVLAGNTVSVSGLAVAGFYAAGANGTDGVSAGTPPTNGGLAVGGAIWNSGSLTVTDCYFSYCAAVGGNGGRAAGNIAQDGAAGGEARGGAIYSDGAALSIVRSTFSSCSATGGTGGDGANTQSAGGGSGNGAPGGAGLGGAVDVGTGTASIVNSTLASNTAAGGSGGYGGSDLSGALKLGGTGGDAQGGALFSNPQMTLTACTFAFNSIVPGQGGYQTDFAHFAAAGTGRGGGVLATALITIGNTLVAKNKIQNPATYTFTPEDVFGGFTSANFNFIGAADNGTGFTGAADQKGTAASPLDPKLASYPQFNGGPTPTLRLRRGSPAVDKGNRLGLTTDQTGSPRPVDLADNGTPGYPNATGGDGSDIGAFESQTLPNDVPVAIGGFVTGTVGVAFSGQAVGGFDGDSDPLTFRLVPGDVMPTGLFFNTDGSVTGTASAITQVTLHYLANDGFADSAPGQLDVFVNEAPSLVVTTDIDYSTNMDGLTSLREALAYAATLGGSQTITFDAAFFATARTITLGSSVNTANSYTLTGPAAGVTISGSDATNLFKVSGGTVNFTKLTLAHGLGNSNYGGGALYINGGTVKVIACTITKCASSAGSAAGGAIFNTGGILTLTNCTLAGNGLSGDYGYGGAIFQNSGVLAIFNCTITDNHASTPTGDGGAIYVTGSNLEIGNSIVSGNIASKHPDISGAFTSDGFNLIGNTSGASFTQDATDQIGADAKLDGTGLAYNGGPVQTIQIFSGSAALDKGKALGGATTDARGLARTFDSGTIANATGGDGTDIGAFEAQAAAREIAVENYDSGTDLLNGSTRDIGAVDVGVPTSVGFTVRNKGGATLTLTGNPVVAISGTNAGEFSVGQPPSQLAAETSQNFNVLFTPTSVGTKSATLTITSDDADEGTFTIPLTATAVDTLTAPPEITSPVSGGAVFPMARVSFTLPEAATVNTVKLSFNNGADSLDFPLGAAVVSAGGYTTTLDATSLPLGTYDLTLTYQDAAGHPAASTTNTNVNIRPAKAVSTTTLAQGAAAPGHGGASSLPGDAVIASFGVPATDDAGDLAFLAKWTSATGGAGGKATNGAGLFLNATCLGIVGGDASAVGGAGVKWKSFSDPVVSDGHAVCIAALSTGASAIVGNLTGAALEKIALTGEVAAGVGGATFKSFKAVAVEPLAQVAFLAQLATGTGTPTKVTAANDIGLWYYGPNNPLFVVREGDVVGGKTIKTLVAFLPGAGSPGQGRGTLIGQSTLANADPHVTALALFTDKTQGLITQDIDTGPPSLALSFSGATATGVDSGATFASYGVPARNHAETATFLGTLTIGPGVTKADASGIFTGPDGTGKFQSVIRIGAAATPAGTGAKFSVLKDPVLSHDGAIAFPATVSGIKGLGITTLWWKPAGQPLALLAQGGARPGLDLPAEAQWKAFTSLAIAGGGRGPIFAATLVTGKGGVTANTASGVWACDFTGAPRVLFRTGDTIGGKVVKSFTLLNATVGSTGVTRSFNNAAQVVWLATFTDKTTALITTEVP